MRNEYAWLIVCGALAGCGGSADVQADRAQPQMTAGGAAEQQPMQTAGTTPREEPMRGQMQEQRPGLEQERPTTQQRPMQRIAMRKGDEDVVVRDVLLTRDPEGNQHLWFFRDDVDCAAVRENPMGDDTFVAMTEVEPGTDQLQAGALPPSQWTYQVDREPQTMAGGQGWVTITRVPDRETVEGVVAVQTTVEDEAFELEGPFTATVCEVTATAVPVGMQQGQQGQQRPGMQGQPQGQQQRPGMQGQPQGQQQRQQQQRQQRQQQQNQPQR